MNAFIYINIYILKNLFFFNNILHELLFASAITIINKSISSCLNIFFQPWMHVCSFFSFFSQHDELFFPGIFFTITVHHFVPTINHYQFSNLFLRPSLYITYIHIDTCVWCEITLRVYECVYTLSKGNKRQKERIIGKKERHYICIYTYYYCSMRVSE